jgi:hypothetical protein
MRSSEICSRPHWLLISRAQPMSAEKRGTTFLGVRRPCVDDLPCMLALRRAALAISPSPKSAEGAERRLVRPLPLQRSG